MKNNERGASFFLKLLIHRERQRPETRRLIIRLHCPGTRTPARVPIRFARHPDSSN